MSDPTGTSSCHLSWWFPLFLQLCLSNIFHSYTCGSTCSSSAQPSSRKAANIPAFPLSSKKTAHSHSESGRDYQRGEQSSLITEITNMLEHKDHMPRWRLTAHKQWHQTQEAPRHPLLSSQTLLCALCDWDLALSSTSLQHPLLYRGRASKAATESSFPYQNSVVLLTQTSWAELSRG